MVRWHDGAGLILILLVSVNFLTPAAGSGNPAPSCTVKFDQPVQAVEVGPGSDGIVNFTGNLICYAEKYEKYTVSLDADSGGWNAAIEPSQFEFGGGGNFSFLLTVHAPPRTSYIVTQKVTVSGSITTRFIRSTLEPASVLVQVKQYFDFEAYGSPSSREVEPGEQACWSITVQNGGNGVDRFLVEVVNLRELVAGGMDVEFQPAVTVEENGRRTFDVCITPGKNGFREQREFPVYVLITSEYGFVSGQSLNFTVILHLDVRPRPLYGAMPGFEGLLLLLAIAAITVVPSARAVKHPYQSP